MINEKIYTAALLPAAFVEFGQIYSVYINIKMNVLLSMLLCFLLPLWNLVRYTEYI